MEADTVLDSYSAKYPWRSTLAIWEYTYIKTGKIPESNLRWLPFSQCPSSACGDIGQHIHKVEGRWEFYCPWCHIHYYVRYREEILNEKQHTGDSPRTGTVH